jgi:hypothetical protein
MTIAVEQTDPLRGSTLRWTWTSGPTKGMTHEHHFHEDGTVEWHQVPHKGDTGPADGSASATKPAERVKYAAFQVRPDVSAVSYRAESGFTLTVVIDFASSDLVGFASGGDVWDPVRGVSAVITPAVVTAR